MTLAKIYFILYDLLLAPTFYAMFDSKLSVTYVKFIVFSIWNESATNGTFYAPFVRIKFVYLFERASSRDAVFFSSILPKFCIRIKFFLETISLIESTGE